MSEENTNYNHEELLSPYEQRQILFQRMQKANKILAEGGDLVKREKYLVGEYVGERRFSLV